SQPFARRGQLLLAEDDDGLYLYARVADARRTRADAEDPNALLADHLILTLGNATGQRRYLLASAAPGPLTALPLDPAVAGLPDQINARWQEDGSGYQVELRLSRQMDLLTLGVGAYDANADGDRMASDTCPIGCRRACCRRRAGCWRAAASSTVPPARRASRAGSPRWCIARCWLPDWRMPSCGRRTCRSWIRPKSGRRAPARPSPCGAMARNAAAWCWRPRCRSNNPARSRGCCCWSKPAARYPCWPIAPCSACC